MLSLHKPEDLFDKCMFVNGILKTTFTNPEYDYYLFDAIFSLNHLFEWYLKDKTKEPDSKSQCIKKFNPFESPYDVSTDFKDLYRGIPEFPSVNQYQYNVRMLCNKAKHFTERKIEKARNETTAIAGHITMFAGGPLAMAGRSMIKYDIDINGRGISIDEAIDSLIKSWSEFLENNK